MRQPDIHHVTIRATDDAILLDLDGVTALVTISYTHMGIAPTEATWVALMVLYTACLRYGVPVHLVSDSGGAYTSADFQAVSVRGCRSSTRRSSAPRARAT